jgi:hypothetical protein
MNNLQRAIMGLASALRSNYYEGSRIPKARNNEAPKSGKTRKGASHIVNPTFKARRIFQDLTPAMYRRFHFGKKDKKHGSQRSK